MADAGIKGLWHLALNVTDVARSRAFYEGLFGMAVVWAPDENNLYLSSGRDNLALHQIPPAELPRYKAAQAQRLDHLGIVVDSQDTVDRLFQLAEQGGIPIVHRPRRHRDESYSCYVSDPDGNTVQILFVPGVSHER